MKKKTSLPTTGFLRECPFCLSTDIKAQNFIVEGTVSCRECCVYMVRRHSPNDDDGMWEAMHAWNTRK